MSYQSFFKRFFPQGDAKRSIGGGDVVGLIRLLVFAIDFDAGVFVVDYCGWFESSGAFFAEAWLGVWVGGGCFDGDLFAGFELIGSNLVADASG